MIRLDDDKKTRKMDAEQFKQLLRKERGADAFAELDAPAPIVETAAPPAKSAPLPIAPATGWRLATFALLGVLVAAILLVMLLVR